MGEGGCCPVVELDVDSAAHPTSSFFRRVQRHKGACRRQGVYRRKSPALRTPTETHMHAYFQRTLSLFHRWHLMNAFELETQNNEYLWAGNCHHR